MSGADDATPLAPQEAEQAESQVPWQRLNARMIWADALRVVLSLAPAGAALLIFGVDPDAGVLWPVLGVAAWGVVGAAADILRWATTRYRLTPTHVERRTGLFFRSNRSIRRERIRSVDTDARLLQRLAGLRRVRVGAGQANTAMESALHLDAVARADAEELQRRLMGGSAEDPTVAAPGRATSSEAAGDTSPEPAGEPRSRPAALPPATARARRRPSPGGGRQR